MYFYPRSPCGERLHVPAVVSPLHDISIHALLAESDEPVSNFRLKILISIHALLAESDAIRLAVLSYYQDISIHALLAESDTCQWRRSVKLFRHFYPRSPCGERPERPVESRSNILISIHALLAESDCHLLKRFLNMSLFLSTLSLRRATLCCAISCMTDGYFYPRSPCGERRVEGDNFFYFADISIHALLAESDVMQEIAQQRKQRISIHALLAESDFAVGR